MMSKKDRRLLEVKLPDLMKEIDLQASTLLAELIKRSVITTQQQEYIRCAAGNTNQVGRLVDLLLKGDEHTVDNLVYSLRACGAPFAKIAKTHLREPRISDPYNKDEQRYTEPAPKIDFSKSQYDSGVATAAYVSQPQSDCLLYPKGAQAKLHGYLGQLGEALPVTAKQEQCKDPDASPSKLSRIAMSDDEKLQSASIGAHLSGRERFIKPESADVKVEHQSAGLADKKPSTISQLSEGSKKLKIDSSDGGPSETVAARRPFKVWDCSRRTRKGIMAASLAELTNKGREKLAIPANVGVTVVLGSDGTLIEDEDYFECLDKNTILLLLKDGQDWREDWKDDFSGEGMDVSDGFSDVVADSLGDEVPQSASRGPDLQRLAARLRRDVAQLVLFSEKEKEVVARASTETLSELLRLSSSETGRIQQACYRELDEMAEIREANLMLNRLKPASAQPMDSIDGPASAGNRSGAGDS